MKKKSGALIVYFLSIFLVFSINCTQRDKIESINVGFDFSGIEEFWKIADILKADIEPSPSQWNSLLSTPGYTVLIGMEFQKPGFFEDYMRAAYMPSQKQRRGKLIKEAKKKGGFRAWFTPALLKAYHDAENNRKEIEARIKELKTYPYVKEASLEALNFLPETHVDEYPAVSFIIFHDSRGYSPLVIGLTGGEDLEKSALDKLQKHGFTKHRPFMLHVAHESFHFYRDKKLEFDFPGNKNPYYHIIWIINQIENEGIADQIDRKQLYYGNGCFTETQMAERWRKEQAEQPKIILEMDSLFTRIEDKPKAAAELGKELRELVPQSGHPTGFFMANCIIEQYGKNAIVEVVRNPFRFFFLYNEAAKKSGKSPFFSEPAMRFIKNLESRYKKK
jgi:hypothetical protein